MIELIMDMNPGFIEKYQMIYERDKTTKLFAPLAEAYRKMGLLKQALEVCENGTKHHPLFISGLVAYSKALIDANLLEKAKLILEKVIDQNSDNLLAQNLLARVLMDLKKPKEALHAYKMLLFLAPNNLEAQKAVKKLESLSAADMDEDFFQLDPLSLFEEVQEDLEEKPVSTVSKFDIDRVLSLADAFSIRNDREKALQVLENARDRIGDHPDIVRRLAVLSRSDLSLNLESPKIDKGKTQRLQKLELALRRIEQNRR